MPKRILTADELKGLRKVVAKHDPAYGSLEWNGCKVEMTNIFIVDYDDDGYVEYLRQYDVTDLETGENVLPEAS